jgi:hypothetical protein
MQSLKRNPTMKSSTEFMAGMGSQQKSDPDYVHLGGERRGYQLVFEVHMAWLTGINRSEHYGEESG